MQVDYPPEGVGISVVKNGVSVGGEISVGGGWLGVGVGLRSGGVVVNVTDGTRVMVRVGVWKGVQVTLGVKVPVGVPVSVAVGNWKGVTVALGTPGSSVAVSVGVGVAVGLGEMRVMRPIPSTINPTQ